MSRIRSGFWGDFIATARVRLRGLFVLNMFIVYAFAALGFIVILYGGKILKTQKIGAEDLSSAARRLVATGELNDLFYQSPWCSVAAVGIFV